MRIEAYNQIQQVYNTKRVRPAQEAQKAYQTDNVQISSLGKDILTAKNAVKDAPDVRSEVVEPLKEKIKNGTYGVDSGDFADKLIARFNATV